MPRFRALQGKYASRLSGILQVADNRKPIAVNLQITGFKANNRVRLSYTRLHHMFYDRLRAVVFLLMLRFRQAPGK